YAPKAGYLRLQLEEIPELRSKETPEWELIETSPLLDSSNVTVVEWNMIASLIVEHYDKFDGFVVLHGTDTMAYTASALSSGHKLTAYQSEYMFSFLKDLTE
ncbi:MAG: asparaginase, partial [Treponema sp.]|nr:asparaginase [Treponema sp.]